MIQSPCRHCPHRYQDKNRCMETCVLLHRVQAFGVGRREPEPYSAVNTADDNRYRLMTAGVLRASGSPLRW